MGEIVDMYVCLDGGRRKEDMRKQERGARMEGERDDIWINNHIRRRGSYGHAILKTKEISTKENSHLTSISLACPYLYPSI